MNAVRTYSVQGTLADIPQLAERHGINVAVGAWIDNHRDTNETQAADRHRARRTHINVVRVFVGNEVVLRGDLPLEELEK